MDPLPCPLCGYDAPGVTCPHCGGTAADPSLAEPRSGTLSGVGDGVLALGHGLRILVGTRGIKRWLVPPLLLTLGLFAFLFAWLWGRLQALLEAAKLGDASQLDIGWSWLRAAVAWLIERGVVVWLAHTASWIVFLVGSSLVALWTFSIAYEALAGPFLDEVHGKLEARWFGRDPRDALHKPVELSGGRIASRLALGAAPLAVGLVQWWRLAGWPAWAWLALTPLGFLAVGLVDRDFGRWLLWIVRLEAHTTWVGLKASALAGALMLLFLWLKLIPFVGYFLFAGLAGFATSVSLLDIPFSRRQWSVRQRLSFLLQNLPATIAFGAIASLLFLVPFLGPLVGVPAASVGGLWLVCRRDKNAMRPRERRVPPVELAPPARVR